MKAKYWLILWLTVCGVMLLAVGGSVYRVDPFFHYHKPNVEKYYYTIDNQRSQNDGIIRNFDYDAMIVGSSMTENFKTTELDDLFQVQSIKVPTSGGSYKEVNDAIRTGFESNPRLKVIVRGLDMVKFFDKSEDMRTDLGEYPTYLYDRNPFNDVKYLFNRDILFERVFPMLTANDEPGFEPGITDFDAYSRWQDEEEFGIHAVSPQGFEYNGMGEMIPLTDEERADIADNIQKNVISLAAEHPEAEFYYFITPYSGAWYKERAAKGKLIRHFEAERMIIEQILEQENIHLFSFNLKTDITMDLNNYSDVAHYGEWVNSLMLKWMSEGEGLLTKDNYLDYLRKEYDFYTNYDYNLLNDQPDFEIDDRQGALLHKEVSGAEPLYLSKLDGWQQNMIGAETITDEGGAAILNCEGFLERISGGEQTLEQYLYEVGYLGTKVELTEIGNYAYLGFEGKKVTDHGQPTICVYDGSGQTIAEFTAGYKHLDNEWHEYLIRIPKASGTATIIFNGGFIDNTGSSESNYMFRNCIIY